MYYLNDSNPFLPWNLTTNFYTQHNIVLKDLENSIFTNDKNSTKMLIVRMSDLNNVAIKNLIAKNKMKEVCKGIPDLIFILLNKWTNKSGKTLILFSNKND